MEFSSGALAVAAEKELSTVQYRLSFRQAETHRVDIEVSVPTDGKAEIEFMMRFGLRQLSRARIRTPS